MIKYLSNLSDDVRYQTMNHADRPNPDTVLLANGDVAATPQDVFSEFERLSIEYQTWEHEPLYTVEQAKQIDYDEPGAHTKNLFLRNKKGRMFLLVVEPDHQVNLRALRDILQLPGGQIAFASTERLGKYLGVVPGSVSPLGLINDHTHAVQLIIEKRLLDHTWIFMHPCRNTHSTRIRTQDLLRLLDAWQHPPRLITFERED